MKESNFIQDWLDEGIQQKTQSIIIRQLQAKFGSVPQTIQSEIRSITNESELDALTLRILKVDSLDEMGFNGQSGNGNPSKTRKSKNGK